ncbi:hypothetical protein O181_093008 [Austropuccinia psidii MF-1]|uniref:Uncharacterized protein n=1 Tax=Austropuccinia psidii MF-1 TaxID=1389203 RepID=A0A9Q3P8Z0_9BASI|nr:hypothetical protein [Austropuccinia psidii MF-1]
MPLILVSPLLMPNPLHCFPTLCSLHALLTCPQFHPHTSLIVNTAYHPYAPAAPSRCDSDAALTTPYAPAPPSR